MDLWHLLFTLALVCANDSLSASDGKFYDTLLYLCVCVHIDTALYEEYFYMCQDYASSFIAVIWVPNVKCEKYIS